MSLQSDYYRLGAAVTGTYSSTSPNPTFTTSQGATVTDVADNTDYLVFDLRGTGGTAGNAPVLLLPNKTGDYVFVNNQCSTSVTAQLSSSDANPVTVSAGSSVCLFCDGSAWYIVSSTSAGLNLASLPSTSTLPTDSMFLVQFSNGIQYSVTFSVLKSLLGVSAVGNVLVAKAMATSNVTLTGTQTIDSVALGVGDVAFVTGQIVATQDGLYVVQSGAWIRTSAMGVGANASPNLVMVQQGTLHQGLYYCQQALGSDIVGTNTLTWMSFVAMSAVSPLYVTNNIVGVIDAPSNGMFMTGSSTIGHGAGYAPNLLLNTDSVNGYHSLTLLSGSTAVAKLGQSGINTTWGGLWLGGTATTLNQNPTLGTIGNTVVLHTPVSGSTVNVVDGNYNLAHFATGSITLNPYVGDYWNPYQVLSLGVNNVSFAPDGSKVTASLFKAYSIDNVPTIQATLTTEQLASGSTTFITATQLQRDVVYPTTAGVAMECNSLVQTVSNVGTDVSGTSTLQDGSAHMQVRVAYNASSTTITPFRMNASANFFTGKLRITFISSLKDATHFPCILDLPFACYWGGTTVGGMSIPTFSSGLVVLEDEGVKYSSVWKGGLWDGKTITSYTIISSFASTISSTGVVTAVFGLSFGSAMGAPGSGTILIDLHFYDISFMSI